MYYVDEEWIWFKGVLCIVDWDYGVFNYVFYYFIDCYVVYYLFFYMFYYYIVEVIEVIKLVLGVYYNYDNILFWKVLWYIDSYCCFVEDSGKILWYKFLFEYWKLD